MLYDRICAIYAPNVPFTLDRIPCDGYSKNYIVQQAGAMVKDGRLRKCCSGVFYRPATGPMAGLVVPVIDDVLDVLYLQDNGRPCGFLGGLLFANQIGVTTQVPAVYEVYTNKASRDTRSRTIGKTKIIIRRPAVPLNGQNMAAIQLLTLVKDIDSLSDMPMGDAGVAIRRYMGAKEIAAASLIAFLDSFPAKTAKNLIGLGVLRAYDAS